jgi:NAD(P)-dependent dehydrogenase (short-subunit alcohol dehydrogenase family)
VARIFITGSTDGLGRAAASVLIAEGHEVVLHARTRARAAAVRGLAPGAAGVVLGDLASAAQTRALAGQVNAIGRMDAVIHNAGVFLQPSGARAAGQAPVWTMNTTSGSDRYSTQHFRAAADRRRVCPLSNVLSWRSVTSARRWPAGVG